MKKIATVLLSFVLLLTFATTAIAQEVLTYTTPDGNVYQFDEIKTVTFTLHSPGPSIYMDNINNVTAAFAIKDGVGYCGGSVNLYDKTMDFDYEIALQKMNSKGVWETVDYVTDSGTGRKSFEEGFSLSESGNYRCQITCWVGYERASIATGGKNYSI